MRLSNVPSALTLPAVRLISNTKKEFIIRAELWHHSCASPLRNFFWREMMLHGTARKLVWDGRAVLGSLLALLGPAAALPLSLHLLDPLVGCWLLRPDHPVNSFPACQELVAPGSRASPPGPRQHAEQLASLSNICRQLHLKLDQLSLWPLFLLEMRVLPLLVRMERTGTPNKVLSAQSCLCRRWPR